MSKRRNGMMMRFLPSSLLLMVCFHTSTPVFSQHRLSLDDCQKIALAQNTTIESAKNAIQSAGLAREELGRSAFPLIKVGGKAAPAPYSDHFGYDPAVTNGGEYSAQLGVQELLYDGGTRSLRSDQFASDIERLSIEQRKTERDLKHAVALSFFDLLEAQEEIVLHTGRVQELEDYLTLVNRLFHGGGVNYTDVLKARVSVDNANLTLQKTQQDLLTSKVSLAEVLGAPEDTSLFALGSFDMPDSSGIERALDNVFADSALDLRIADLAVKKSLFDVDIARRERYPTVSLNGDVGLLTSGDNLRLPSDQRASMIGVSIGLSIEHVLFNWGMTDLRIQQQQLATDNVRLQYVQQRRTMTADIGRLRNDIMGTMNQLRLLQRTIKTAEDNYTLTKAQYAGGGTTALEVLSAEQLLAENNLAELQTRAGLTRLLAKVRQLSEH